MSFTRAKKAAIFLRMPPKDITPEDLEQQSATLQALIDDAQALQKEITEHLKKLRRTDQSNPQPLTERRRKPRHR